MSDAPQIIRNRLYIDEDTPVSFTSDEIARFIHDADNDIPTLEQLTNVTGGTVNSSDGVYTFTPDKNYYGQASFDYSAKDNDGFESAINRFWA